MIVPVYKVEMYLEKCVRSILLQSYNDLEVILVNDGSPDGCPAICDDFAAKDARVRVIHKENGGLISARNAGLDIASGEFIAFVDSDDYILPDMYEKMHAKLIEEKADICVCGYKMVGDEIERDITVNLKGKQSAAQIWKLFLTDFILYSRAMMSPWNRLIRAKIVKGEGGLRLPNWPRITPDGQRITDSCAAFNADCLAAAANGIVFIDYAAYIYRLAEQAGSLSTFRGTKNLEMVLEHIAEVIIQAMPHRAREIENIYESYIYVNYVSTNQEHMMRNGARPLDIPFSAVCKILRHTPSYSLKIQALCMYFLPDKLYMFILRLYYAVV